MSRIRQEEPRGALDEGRRSEVQRHIKSFEKEYSGGGANMGRRRPKPGSVVVASIPARGTLDDEGNAFSGLPSTRLQDSILSDATLHHLQDRPNYMDNTIGQGGKIRSIPNDVKLTRENVVGEVVQSGNVVSLSPSKLDRKIRSRSGSAAADNEIDWGNDSIPRAAIGKGKVSDNEISDAGWSKIGTSKDPRPKRFPPRSHNNADHSVKFAKANHKHSQSIKLMSIERRRAACELRESLRALPSGELRDGLLVLMALAFDDPTYTLDSTLSYSAEEMVERHYEETAWGEDDHHPILSSHPDLDSILVKLEGR